MLDAVVATDTMHDDGDRAAAVRLPGRHECRYPHGDPKADDFRFCCLAVASAEGKGLRSVYCQSHAWTALSPVMRPDGPMVAAAAAKAKPVVPAVVERRAEPVVRERPPQKRVRNPDGRPGRQPSFTDEALRALHAQGYDQTAIAQALGCARSGICRAMKRLNLAATRPGVSGPARVATVRAAQEHQAQDQAA